MKGINMFTFYINRAVDAVQNAKKTWVSNNILDADLAGHLNKFVETQTEYTKAAAQNFESAGMALSGYTIGKTQSALKTATDWTTKTFSPKQD